MYERKPTGASSMVRLIHNTVSLVRMLTTLDLIWVRSEKHCGVCGRNTSLFTQTEVNGVFIIIGKVRATDIAVIDICDRPSLWKLCEDTSPQVMNRKTKNKHL